MGTAGFKESAAGLFGITTPDVGESPLLLRGFRGSEGISRLFRFELDLVSEGQGIDYTKIIGKPVTISLKQADGKPRYFNGVVSRFGQGAEDGSFTTYHAEIVPKLWLLTRMANCCIFQNLTAPAIIKQILAAQNITIKDSMTGTYVTREYCVQYRETHFSFISRLMEEEGIFYYFQHEDGQHTMVLASDSTANPDCPGQNSFALYTESTAVLDLDVVQSWQAEQELRTGKYTMTDYNFETPTLSLQVSTNTINSVGGNSQFEMFDYPGEYGKTADGNSLVKTRMEEEESVNLVYHGSGDARCMTTGCKFTLTDHYLDSMNGSYLLTDIQHVGTISFGASQAAADEHYTNSFRCIPAKVKYRPLRVTPRPTISGPQPALVVGAAGDEICTDKYGRIKVQFYWDRLGKKNDSSSCWMRVSQFWAGKQWGAIFLPRVGQEVLVDFLEGDPDQPLVTGSVYNAAQMPPYTLPDNMTQSGILTRSSKNGTSDNYNQLRFEDKKGSEQILIHAEKDMLREVENDDTLTVGKDQSITITGNRSEIVDKGDETVELKKGKRTHTIDTGDDTLIVKTGNRLVEVDTGNDTHTVKTGNREVTVSTGNDTHKISTGDRSVTISTGNDSLTISMGNQTTTVSLGSISTSAMQSITLTVGGNSIKIDTSGVTITGTMVSVSAQASCDISSSGPLSLSGAMTSVNS